MTRTIILLLAVASAVCAQTVSTEILGLVTDPTGAVITGATITAKRVATGDVRTTKSNDTGNYIFPLLDIGEYEVTCSAPGFKTEVRRGVVLQLQQRLRIDFQLQVGQQVETVEVSGTASLLRTEDATLGSVIEARRVVELPLNGRNFAQLATLMPGVVYGVSRMGLDGQGGFPIPGQMVAISANGQRDINQHVTVDGVVAVEPRVNTMTFVPSIEAIEEFKVQSAVYTAEYGMNSGAQVNVAIKSGTNNFHGTLFEFVRNDRFDARGFFLPRDQTKNKLRRNQFGTVLSGPIVRDRTFWLFNFEGRRERRAIPSRAAVPTLAMRQGDFSEIIQPGNRWYPRDANPAATRAIRAPGSAVPFPNNVIPPSLFNRVARNLLTWDKHTPFPGFGFLIPPNIDAEARALNSPINLAGTNDQIIGSDQFLGRLDHRFGDHDRIFGRFVYVDAAFDSIPLLKVNKLLTTHRPKNIAIGYSKIIRPTVLNEFRYGLNASPDEIAGPHTNTDFTQRDLGLDFRVVGDNNRQLRKDEEGLPTISIAGFAGIPVPSTAGWYDVHRVHEFTDNVTVNRGRHNFKFGGLYRWNFLDRGAANLPRGRLTFDRNIVGIPDAFASFVLGLPDLAETAEGVPPLFARQHKYAFYWLDDFKATPRLTVNFGVRYDLFGVVTDAKGKFRNLSFENRHARTVNNMFVPMLVPNPNVREALYDINKAQIMPRLGIAYRLTGSLVLRMGAGQFYNAQQINNFSILNLQPPFSGSNLFQNDRTRPIATLDNPFAGSPTAQPTALLMLGHIQADRGQRSLYLNNDTWQWSTEVEKSWGQNFVTGMAYVGSKSSNLDFSILNFNNPDPGLGSIQARRPIQFYVDSRDPNTLLPLSTVRRLETAQNASYHALQARAERRHARGLTFVASYNFQKAIAVAYGANEGAAFGQFSVQNPRDTRLERGRSRIDNRHRFVFSNVWDLPWFRDASGAKRWILGGWSINGIFHLTSGLPVSVVQTGDSHNTGAASSPRPHATGKVSRVMDGRSLDRWFDTGAFTRSKCDGCPGEGLFLEGTQGYGNAGVSLFDAPAQKQWDFALFKGFRVREGHRVQFRWEVFNFLNTPQFSAPDAALGSATYGRITSTLSPMREMQFALKYIF